MATERQTVTEAANYLRGIAPYSPDPQTGRLYAEHQRVHEQIDDGLLTKVKTVGAYAARLVRELDNRHIEPTIELELVETAPSVSGMQPVAKRSIGPGWVLLEHPARYVPESVSVPFHAVDWSHNEIIIPAHVAPAYGYALRPDASIASYSRDEDGMGDVIDSSGETIFRFDSLFIPAAGNVVLSAGELDKEALAILEVCGVENPKHYINFIDDRCRTISRAADGWMNLLRQFSDAEYLG